MNHKKTVKSRYDETVEHYNGRYSEIQNLKYQIILKHISIGTEQAILDVGCGTGNFFLLLESNNCHKYGIDFSIESLKKFRKSIGREEPVHHICADAEYLPFRKGLFDVIFAITLLQNLPDPRKCLEEMKNLYKPTGLLILSLLKNKFPVERIEGLLEKAQLEPLQIINDSYCEDIIVIVGNKKIKD